jgi:hypothetical protein
MSTEPNGYQWLADQETIRRAEHVTPNPMGWGVTIEGLGTDLPLYVTVWSGPSMISRETFGTEAEAQARANVLRGRIYEAREAWTAKRDYSDAFNTYNDRIADGTF